MAFNEKTLQRLQQRVKGLVDSFPEALDRFEKAVKQEGLFGGPSIYFHRKTRCMLDQRLQLTGCPERALADCIEDQAFLESLYATLTAWGLHRMGPKQGQLVDFASFAATFRSRKDQICSQSNRRIEELEARSVGGVAGALWGMIEGLNIGYAEAKIVRGAKALHHLLPDLIPPIDREYTLKFFFHVTTFHGAKEADAFYLAYKHLWEVAVTCRGEIQKRLSQGGQWSTSFTKVIDNAIIGYVTDRPNM